MLKATSPSGPDFGKLNATVREAANCTLSWPLLATFIYIVLTCCAQPTSAEHERAILVNILECLESVSERASHKPSASGALAAPPTAASAPLSSGVGAGSATATAQR